MHSCLTAGNILHPFLVQFAYKSSQEVFIIRASDAALWFFNILDIFGNQGATRDPLPKLRYPCYWRPKLKIWRAMSLDVLVKISHTIFWTNRMINKGRKLPAVFEYSELFPQLCTWCKLLDSLDIFRNIPLIHSNKPWTVPSLPVPPLYLLRHTLM